MAVTLYTVSAVGVAGERDNVAVARLLTFFNHRNGVWKTPTGEAWQPALAIEAVVNTYERTRDSAYKNAIEKSFARYRGRRSDFFDDDGWYLNAWLRAYDVTGDPRYLDEARSLFQGLTAAWDDVCRGGLRWHKRRGYKNAITNELFLLAAARLHRRAPSGTGAGGYYDWAMRCWGWFHHTGMINAAGMVNDGLSGSCVNNGETTWTCNQGVILGALVELWRVTGDRAYLVQAQQIAEACMRTHVDEGGILREPCEPVSCHPDAHVFKGVFTQGLARLFNVDRDGQPTYWTFLSRNADSVWHASRDDGFGLIWRGPVGKVNAATQTSATLLLGAVALLGAGGETEAVAPCSM